MAITATFRSRSPPFNVTSALGRGILWGALIAMFIHPVLQRHLGAGPRDTNARTCSNAIRAWSLQRHLGAWPRDTTASEVGTRPGCLPFNVTSALGRGIRARSTGGKTTRKTFNVTSALGRGIPRGRPRRLDHRRDPSTSPRHLAEGYHRGGQGRAGTDRPSTSPRRWAEGYPVVPVDVAHRRRPSTSPRRWAEGYGGLAGH